ncbi:MAG: hypothetical protein JNK05_16715 [Myxococcales bacterium]|nr:hypothetical protein [Myxococcales bacterium]
MQTASVSSSLLSLLAQHASFSRFDYDQSWVGVAIVGFLLLGGLFFTAVFGEWRARRRAAALRQAIEGKTGPLAPGECVLRGTIETDDPDGRAVAVELLQVGQNYQTKNGPAHTWTETARRVDARAFYLRLEDGRAVRVEPDQRVFVVDALDGARRVEFNQRVRTAEVRKGDQVYVIGSLVEGYDPRAQVDGGYRGAKGKSLVVRSSKGRAMLVSTEAPTERHVRREGFHGNWALLTALAFVLINGIAFGSFHILAWTGTNVEATVVERTQQYHRTKNGGYYSYHLRAQYENVSGHRVSVTDEVSRTAFTADETEPGRRVMFTVSPASSRIAQIGSKPGVTVASVLVSGLLSLILATIYYATVRGTRPWYDRKKVVEHGSGAFV